MTKSTIYKITKTLLPDTKKEIKYHIKKYKKYKIYKIYKIYKKYKKYIKYIKNIKYGKLKKNNYY